MINSNKTKFNVIGYKYEFLKIELSDMQHHQNQYKV